MGKPSADPVIAFDGPAAWRAWLDEHHRTAGGVWVKMAKKASGIPSVTHPEALEEALCYGWIDGQRRTLDDQWFLQRFTPRRPRSTWSKINCAKVERLLDAGRMRPAGLAEVDRAKADGRWDAAYEPPSKATVPPDLQRALDRNPAAAAFFATLNSQDRFVILRRIEDAKKPETRARRIEKSVTMLTDQTKPHS
jgi:uncharacterized protein YdeI (YjbR/CyaY-like superfamily)